MRSEGGRGIVIATEGLVLIGCKPNRIFFQKKNN